MIIKCEKCRYKFNVEVHGEERQIKCICPRCGCEIEKSAAALVSHSAIESINSERTDHLADEERTSRPKEETKRCPYCGEEILAIARKCKHCGSWLDEQSENNHQQAISVPTVPQEPEGRLRINWPGKWNLIDHKMKVFIDKELVGEYSFKTGFSLSVPINKPKMEVKISYSLVRVKKKLSLELGVNYCLDLIYSSNKGMTTKLRFDNTDYQ